MYHESSCLASDYHRETVMELMLAELETQGCAGSIAGTLEKGTVSGNDLRERIIAGSRGN